MKTINPLHLQMQPIISMGKLNFKEGKKYTFSDYFDLNNPPEEIADEVIFVRVRFLSNTLVYNDNTFFTFDFPNRWFDDLPPIGGTLLLVGQAR